MLGRSVQWVCALAWAVVIVVTGPASAQTAAEADKLNAEVIRLYRAGKYSEAIPLAQQTLELREKSLGPEHPDVATSLNNLAELYKSQGLYSEAEPLHERALAIRVKALGSLHTDVAASLNDLALLYRAQGRYAEAEKRYKQSLTILEQVLGPDDPNIGALLNNIAGVYRAQGRYAEAEQHYKRALAVREKALGPHHPDVGQSLHNLAGLFAAQHRYREAEPLAKRDLAIAEKALGPDHPTVGMSLNNLAELFRQMGRHVEAEPIYKRGLALREKVLGAEHPDVGRSLNNLALLYNAEGRYVEAEQLFQRSLKISEKSLGPNHPEVGTLLTNLVGLYTNQGQYEKAEMVAKRALIVAETGFGPSSHQAGAAISALADLYQAQGRAADAETQTMRSLALIERSFGPDHLDVGASLNNAAWLALSQNNIAGAADRWRRATSILQRRVERGLGGTMNQTSEGQAQRNSFVGLIKTTHLLVAQGSADYAQHLAEMFKAAQWSQASEAAVSLTQMAARSAKGSRELAVLVRERQDLVSEWQAMDKLRIAAWSEPPSHRNAANEKVLGDRLAAIDGRFDEIDRRLAREFPNYAALSSPGPVSVADVQSALSADEVLVLFLDMGTNWAPVLPEETFVWVVTKNDVRWVRSEFGTAVLQREVAALRCGLDATAWNGDGSSRCAELLKLPPELVPKDGQALPYDAARAHALYKSLLGDAADLIKGKHLLIVPSGALTTLPFQVLVTEPPMPGDLKSVRWLARDHAITVLPSVASLKALRRTGKPSEAPNPMIGFGNPLLDGDQAHPQHGAYFKEQAQIARTQTGCAKSPQTRTASLRVVARSLAPLPVSGRTADLNHLRMQAPLPETAEELCGVAWSVGGNEEDVRIGARATEAEVKRLSSSGELAKYRILHFATHGTLAGQLKGTSEPGLILTPPKTATDEDDGYLSGSEIASLKLDADWVILSACNTAGGAGQSEAAEALSGLARVFFYAGARALLVSHWEVDSAATVMLITTALAELAKDKSIGRAEAMRRAMLAVMSDTSRPANWVPAWHPSVWAPFVVVGEGGVGR